MGILGYEEQVIQLENTSGKDGNNKDESNTVEEIRTAKTQLKSLSSQVLVTVAISFGSLIGGFAVSYSAPALASLSKPESNLHPSSDEKSWIGSLMPLFGLVGGIIGGPLMESIGRKRTLILTGLPSPISFLLIAFASNVTMILIGRSIIGLVSGVISLVFPIYLGETIEPKYRGLLGILPGIFGNSGIVIGYTVGMFLDWSKLALVGAFIPIPYIVCTFLIPETPRWYISKGKEKKSMKSLQTLRGQNDITDEFKEIQTNYNQSKQSNSSYKDLFSAGYCKPLFICLALMLFQQLSGINVILFYSVEIFRDSKSHMDSNIQSIVLAAVNILATVIATLLVDRMGRKILLLASSITMVITLGLFGLYFRLEDEILKNYNIQITQNYGYVPLVCLMVFIIGFSMGFGPIPWLMMGELLPGRIRGVGASITSSFNWACTFLVTKTFSTMVSTLGLDITFWIYGSFSILAVVFTYFCVPETKGKSLEDIERMFIGPNSNNNSTKDNNENTNEKRCVT